MLLRQYKLAHLYKTHVVYKRREMESHIQEYNANEEDLYIIEAQTKQGFWYFHVTIRPFTLGHLINHSVTLNISCINHSLLAVSGGWGFWRCVTLRLQKN